MGIMVMIKKLLSITHTMKGLFVKIFFWKENLVVRTNSL